MAFNTFSFSFFGSLTIFFCQFFKRHSSGLLGYSDIVETTNAKENIRLLSHYIDDNFVSISEIPLPAQKQLEMTLAEGAGPVNPVWNSMINLPAAKNCMNATLS